MEIGQVSPLADFLLKMVPVHQLIEGCKRNDRKSQKDLYYAYYPAMFSLCKKFFSDEHDVVTALNNGMLRVFKHIDQYEDSKGTFFNWTYTVVRNACITQLRDQRKVANLVEYKEVIPEFIATDPFQESSWDETFQYLDKLPPSTRAVCSLFYLEDFSIRDIANALDLQEGTVKWHLNESRRRLREIFIKPDNQRNRL